MKQRANEFIKERENISISEMRTWGAEVLSQWLNDWSNYIKSGGVRPGRPH